MAQLLSKYSIGEIVMFLVLLAAAIKGVVSFFEWSYEKLKAVFNNEKEEESDHNKIQELIESQKQLTRDVQKLSEKITMLVQSDKDDIKSFLTRQHHYFCYNKHWIDDYSLQCCERRYSHYVEQGGNSFIEGFMKQLRALPKRPPDSKE